MGPLVMCSNGAIDPNLPVAPRPEDRTLPLKVPGRIHQDRAVEPLHKTICPGVAPGFSDAMDIIEFRRSDRDGW